MSVVPSLIQPVESLVESLPGVLPTGSTGGLLPTQPIPLVPAVTSILGGVTSVVGSVVDTLPSAVPVVPILSSVVSEVTDPLTSGLPVVSDLPSILKVDSISEVLIS